MPVLRKTKQEVKPTEVKPAEEISTDEARVKRRVENQNLTQAKGSTFYEDVDLKNAKVGDEINFEEYKDGEFKSYDTKVKEIVDGKVIFENGKTEDNVSSFINKTAEDAWFAKNHPELTLEKPKEGPPPMPEGFDVFAENKPKEVVAETTEIEAEVDNQIKIVN